MELAMIILPEPEYAWKLYRVIEGQFFAYRQLFIWLKGVHLQDEQREHPSMSF
jgi:hypothetical protein